jgi:hypothetical protein
MTTPKSDRTATLPRADHNGSLHLRQTFAPCRDERDQITTPAALRLVAYAGGEVAYWTIRLPA